MGDIIISNFINAIMADGSTVVTQGAPIAKFQFQKTKDRTEHGIIQRKSIGRKKLSNGIMNRATTL